MSRVLLALSLSLLATSAFAAPIAITTDDTAGGACPKAAKAATPASADADTDPTPGKTDASPATPHHIRGGSAHPAIPRWHSMLPGMFR